MSKIRAKVFSVTAGRTRLREQKRRRDHTTTLSRFAARVMPVYSQRARLSWKAKLSSNSTTSSHCEPYDLCTVST